MNPIDLEALRRGALTSPQGEYYTSLTPHGDNRIGVGARIKQKETKYFIEVIVPLCRGAKPSLTDLDAKLTLLKELEARGYTLTCEDDGSVSCEMLLPESGVAAELRRLYKSDLVK